MANTPGAAGLDRRARAARTATKRYPTYRRSSANTARKSTSTIGSPRAQIRPESVSRSPTSISSRPGLHHRNGHLATRQRARRRRRLRLSAEVAFHEDRPKSRPSVRLEETPGRLTSSCAARARCAACTRAPTSSSRIFRATTKTTTTSSSAPLRHQHRRVTSPTSPPTRSPISAAKSQRHRRQAPLPLAAHHAASRVVEGPQTAIVVGDGKHAKSSPTSTAA